MERLAHWKVHLSLLLLVASAALLPAVSGDARATEDLELSGSVLTGDGSSAVRGASVTLLVYNLTDDLVHTDFAVTGPDGGFSFTVPASSWDEGVNATLRATYTLVGANAQETFRLGPSASQAHDVLLPWNRSVGLTVTADPERVSTPRDGSADYIVNVTNDGNDTDEVSLATGTDHPSLVAVFNPGNRTELDPGETDLLGLRVSGPGLPPGEYAVTVNWTSERNPSAKGSLEVVWVVRPEVDLELPPARVMWWPDPLYDGDQALLNCTVNNTGRDEARLANVTVEVIHPTRGQVHRDKVRVDVPGLGGAVASFPWEAEYSEEPYQVTFEVEHPLDSSQGDDTATVTVPVGVRNEPPSVSFTSPANGSSVNGTVFVRLSLTDPDTPVEGLWLRIGGGDWIALPTEAPIRYDWDTTAVEDGYYLLEAYARDAYATSVTAATQVKVENAGPNDAPSVIIDVPQEGDVVDDVLMASGLALDPNDDEVSVEYRLDGGFWSAAEGGAYWHANVSTTTLAEGPHVLEVRASDGIDPSEVVAVNFSVTHSPPALLTMSLEVSPPSVLPGTRVEVRGELVYDNGLRAAGEQVRIEGPMGLLVFKETDARGTFTVSTTAPSKEGTYTYAASATDDDGLAASNTSSLKVLKSLDPDLSVRSVRVVGGKLAVGINVTVEVVVENLGVSTGSGRLRAWEGSVGSGEPVEERNVTVYTSTTLSFQWVPSTDGDVDLVVEVVDVTPVEADYTNNRLTETFAVQDLPDLVVGSIRLSSEIPYANQSFTVFVRVDNEGGLNASCTVRLYLDSSEESDLVGEKEVDVERGGYSTVPFDASADKGSHRVYVELVNAYPEESREDNNAASLVFNARDEFTPEPEPERGEFFFTSIGGLVLLAVVAVVFVAVLAIQLRTDVL